MVCKSMLYMITKTKQIIYYDNASRTKTIYFKKLSLLYIMYIIPDGKNIAKRSIIVQKNEQAIQKSISTI